MKRVEGEPLEPDQVLTQQELDALHFDGVMRGCPGYEYLEEEFERPNWPPRRDLSSRLRGVIDEVRFRLKHPHAYRAFKNLERESGKG